MPNINDYGERGVNLGQDGKIREEVVIFDVNKAVAITPSDAADIAPLPSDCIYLGTSGDLKVTMYSGDVVTFTGMAAGIIHRLSVRRIWATGTTATNIIALYD